MSINRALISGNLTRDPELRQTTGGTQVLSFGVAVNDRRRNQQTGEWEDYPNYIDVTVFGNRAEPLSRYLGKGVKVAVEGKLRYTSWEGRDGQRRSKVEVVADDVVLMQRPRQQAPHQPYGTPEAPSQPRYSATAPTNQQPRQDAARTIPGPLAGSAQAPADGLYDEDVPF